MLLVPLTAFSILPIAVDGYVYLGMLCCHQLVPVPQDRNMCLLPHQQHTCGSRNWHRRWFVLKQITTQYSAYFSDQKEVEMGGKLIFGTGEGGSELGEGEGGKKFSGGQLEGMYTSGP